LSQQRRNQGGFIRNFILLISFGCLAFANAGAQAPQRILVVVAHPDDEILIAPLISSYTRRGVIVQLVIATRGDRGDPRGGASMPGEKLAEVRAEEARCSARALGAEPPEILHFRDGNMGQPAQPPWQKLSEVSEALAKIFDEARPDAVLTFGPEGGYGHPDHRLVGAVVTELIQRGARNTTTNLFYFGFPTDRLAKAPPTGFPFSGTDRRFLTVQVPYGPIDENASRTALACHESQFPKDQMGPLASILDQILGGKVYLRPWFGSVSSSDVLQARAP
jgi:N-acetyl-1-D-myo-inositol-2-amino-2-deoxy-alpha-D-glucopyranoside deacetylase